MTCRYTLKDADGKDITLVGKPALKAWLASGGLQILMPDRAKAAGIQMRAPAAARKTPIASAVSQSVADTERFARTIASGWDNPPEIIVAETMQDPRIPEEVRAEDQRQRSGGSRGEPEGFYYRGQVFLINSQLRTPRDVARVLFHESLGHYGLRGLFGTSLKPILQEIVQRRKVDVIAKAKSYGLDVADPEDMLVAAEEVLAELAQTRPQAGFVQRAIAAIRTWLRENVPGFADLEPSDAELIRDFILPARNFVQNGVGIRAGSAAGSVNSASNQGGANGGRLLSDEFGRITQSDAFQQQGFDGLDVPSQRVVLADMLGAIKDLEVRDAVIGLLPVDMVDMLSGEKFPTDVLLHDDAVLESLLTTAEGDSAVSLSGDGATALVQAVASVVAKQNAAGNFGANSGSGFAAVSAGEQNSARGDQSRSASVGAAKRIVDRVLNSAGRSLKFDAALATIDGRHVVTPVNNMSGVNAVDAASTPPSIRFSRAEPAADTGLTPPEPGMLTKVRAAVQDNMNRVKAVQNRIEKLIGGKLPEIQNYYGAETNRPGRIAARLEDVRDRMMKPLIERLAANGYTMPQLSELLHAQHAQERNEAVERINPDVTDGSGMSSEKASEVLAKYAGERELLRIADDARRMARATLDLKLAYGLIDEDTYATLTERYENYVPLKGDGEYGPKIKRAMGHGERDEFILENIARDYDQAVVVGEKNLARQSLLAMVLENPDENLWTVGVPPKGRYVAGKIYSVQKNGKQVASFTSMAQVTAFLESKGSQANQYEVVDSNGERVQSFVKPLQDNEVPIYVGGQLVRIQINGDDMLARQLRPLDQGRMNPILEGMRGMTRYLSKIYTGYNPYFILRNLARDLLTGSINITGNEGATMLARAWANYPQAFAALGQWAATKKLPQTEAGKYLAEYRANGGKTGASWMGDLEQQAKTLERLFDDAYGVRGYAREGRMGKAAMVGGRKTVAGLAHVIEIANQATENSLRLSLYIAMRKQGVKASEAARAAKTVTVDFDRKGSMTGALGAIYLFFNPAVQGTANALRTLAQGEHRMQAWTALGALALLGFYAASAGMDDDKDRWLGESWDSRSKTLILKAGDYQIRVPLSLEFAPFYALGVTMGEASRGESKVPAAGHMMSSFLNAYFPLGGIYDYDSDNHAMDAAQAVVPTVVKPPFEIATNRNIFGSQIVPENEFTKERADNLKMNRTTKGTAFDTAAQNIAAIGEVFGAGKYENDLSKVSPETLKYLWRTYTGGLGSFVTDTISTGKLKAQGAELEAGEIPFVKDFVRHNDVRAIRSRYYQLADEAKKAAAEFSLAKKAGDDAEIDKIMADPKKSPLIDLDRLIRTTSQSAAKLRDEAVEINADTSLSVPEKRAKLKDLEKQEEDLYRQAIEAFQ